MLKGSSGGYVKWWDMRCMKKPLQYLLVGAEEEDPGTGSLQCIQLDVWKELAFMNAMSLFICCFRMFLLSLNM